MNRYSVRICKRCSTKEKEIECNHEQTKVKNMIVRRCCVCHLLTYYEDDGEKVIPKEKVFSDYPDLLEEKKKKLEELKLSKCAKCSKSGNPNNMWCWELPWCICEVKSLREEIEGKCENPLTAKEHINNILDK